MQPLQLLYHGKNTFDTPSKLELSMSHKHSLGIEKVTTVVPFIFESNPWVCIIIRNMTITSDETIPCRFSQAGNL